MKKWIIVISFLAVNYKLTIEQSEFTHYQKIDYVKVIKLVIRITHK